MRIEWEDGARASFRRHLRDQDGMLAVLAAIDALPTTLSRRRRRVSTLGSTTG